MTRIQLEKCKLRREARDGPDLFDMVTGMPFAIVPPSEISDITGKDEEEAETSAAEDGWVAWWLAAGLTE